MNNKHQTTAIIMPTKKPLCCCLITVLITVLSACASAPPTNSHAHHQTAKHAYYAQGWGATSCQQLSTDLSTQQLTGQQATANRYLYQAWISGFISGVNYADMTVYDISGDTSSELTLAWIEQHCQHAPNDSIPSALHQLMQNWQTTGRTNKP